MPLANSYHNTFVSGCTIKYNLIISWGHCSLQESIPNYKVKTIVKKLWVIILSENWFNDMFLWDCGYSVIKSLWQTEQGIFRRCNIIGSDTVVDQGFPVIVPIYGSVCVIRNVHSETSGMVFVEFGIPRTTGTSVSTASLGTLPRPPSDTNFMFEVA